MKNLLFRVLVGYSIGVNRVSIAPIIVPRIYLENH